MVLQQQMFLSQDIGGISEQIIRLNTILDETSAELDILKSEIETLILR